MAEDQTDIKLRISAKDYQDFEFILDGMEQFVKLSPEEQFAKVREDPWTAIMSPTGPNGAQIPLSRENSERFNQIAIRGLKQAGLGTSAKHRVSKVIEAIKNEFILRVLNGFEFTAENSHDLFNSSVEKRRMSIDKSHITFLARQSSKPLLTVSQLVP